MNGQTVGKTKGQAIPQADALYKLKENSSSGTQAENRPTSHGCLTHSTVCSDFDMALPVMDFLVKWSGPGSDTQLKGGHHRDDHYYGKRIKAE